MTNDYAVSHPWRLRVPIYGILLIFTHVVLATQPPTALQPFNPSGCEKKLKRLWSTDPISFSTLERQIASELKGLFSKNQEVLWIWRNSIYRGTAVNQILLDAIETLPVDQRTATVRNCLLVAQATGQAPYYQWQTFENAIFKQSVKQDPKLSLLKRGKYSYFDLERILRSAEEAGNAVQWFKNGFGEFAILTSSSGVPLYFTFDPEKWSANEVSKSEFEDRFYIRSRQATSDSPDPVSQFLAHLPEGPRKLAYEYVVSSMSEESYRLARDFLEQDRGSVFSTTNVAMFFRRLWEHAEAFGVQPKITENEYATYELQAMFSAFKISWFVDTGGSTSPSYIVFAVGNEKLVFLEEHNSSGGRVYRRTTMANLNRLLKIVERNEEEMLQQFTSLTPFFAQVDSQNIPPQIARLSPDRILALNTILNPGYTSIGGFKAVDDRVEDLITNDSQVIRERGYTHQILAQWLNQLIAMHNTGTIHIVSGHELVVEKLGSRGLQKSPFGDNYSWNSDYLVTDWTTGRRIQFSGGHPYMIGYYGFFEGHIPYRLDPTELIDFIESIQIR